MTNTLSGSLCKSVQLDPLYSNCTTKSRINSRRKSRIKFPMGLVNVSHLIFSVFVKKWLIYTRHGSKTNEQTPTTSKLIVEFTYNNFLCHLLSEQRYSSYTYYQWKWIIISVRTLNVFERKIVVRVIKLEFVCQTVVSFVWIFFLTRSLIDMCQIVTCTC